MSLEQHCSHYHGLSGQEKFPGERWRLMTEMKVLSHCEYYPARFYDRWMELWKQLAPVEPECLERPVPLEREQPDWELQRWMT